MLRFFKRVLINTPLEAPAQFIYQRLFQKFDRSARYDLETGRIMKRVLEADSNCIDIGCYRGIILREFLHYSPDGEHFAFEPVPDLYDGLKAQFDEMENVSLYNIALSDEQGEKIFYDIKSRRACSGFDKRGMDKEEEVTEIKVKTDTLDNILPPEKPIDMIKIDVEGAELFVFKGAKRTITTHKPIIIFEHGKGGADCFGHTPNDIYSLLVEDYGMKIYLLEDWLKSNPPLSQKELTDQFYKHINFYFLAAY